MRNPFLTGKKIEEKKGGGSKMRKWALQEGYMTCSLTFEFKNGQKQPKMAKNGQKWPKTLKM